MARRAPPRWSAVSNTQSRTRSGHCRQRGAAVRGCARRAARARVQGSSRRGVRWQRRAFLRWFWSAALRRLYASSIPCWLLRPALRQEPWNYTTTLLLFYTSRGRRPALGQVALIQIEWCTASTGAHMPIHAALSRYHFLSESGTPAGAISSSSSSAGGAHTVWCSRPHVLIHAALSITS